MIEIGEQIMKKDDFLELCDAFQEVLMERNLNPEVGLWAMLKATILMVVMQAEDGRQDVVLDALEGEFASSLESARKLAKAILKDNPEVMVTFPETETRH